MFTHLKVFICYLEVYKYNEIQILKKLYSLQEPEVFELSQSLTHQATPLLGGPELETDF